MGIKGTQWLIMGFENNSLIVKYWKLYLRNQANESNMSTDHLLLKETYDSEQCRSRGRFLLLNLKSHWSKYTVYLNSHVSQSPGPGTVHLPEKCKPKQQVCSHLIHTVVYDLGRHRCVTSQLWTHAVIVFVSLYPQNIKTRKVRISTVQLSFLQLKKKKIYGESQWDDWVSKVTCHQAWSPEFKSQDPRGWRSKAIAAHCLHTCTLTPHCDTHAPYTNPTLWHTCTLHEPKTTTCKIFFLNWGEILMTCPCFYI